MGMGVGIVGVRIAGSGLGGEGRLVMELLIRCVRGTSIMIMMWKLVFIMKKLVMKHVIVSPFLLKYAART